MRKIVTVLSLHFIFVTTIFVNCAYSNPQYAPEGQHGHSSASAEVPLIGKIAETMNSGGYTYILLQTMGKQIWVAIRETQVSVGQDIALMPGIEMTNFTAKSIGRTFDSIIFSEGPVSKQGSASGGHGHSGAPHGSPHGGAAGAQKSTPGSKGATPPSYGNINIDKATGPNAYTVVELYEKRSELNKKDIVLKGQVVKVSPEIMGKNWLHIQDGTGYSQNSTNDIVVTTKDSAAVGDVVTINGVLYENKDFGSGYKYDAIIEQAQVKNSNK